MPPQEAVTTDGGGSAVHVYNVALASFVLLAWPWYLRDLIALVHPAVRQLATDAKEMRHILEPILAERQRGPPEKKLSSSSPPPPPVDVLGAMLADAASVGEEADVGLLVEDMLSVANLGTHVTSTAVSLSLSPKRGCAADVD